MYATLFYVNFDLIASRLLRQLWQGGVSSLSWAKLRFSGVELEVEDERELATAAFSSLQNQLASAVQPALSKALLGGGPVIDTTPTGNSNGSGAGTRKPRRKLSPSGSSSGTETSGEAIHLTHDPDKFGNPQESWNTADEGVWMLWVLGEATDRKQFTVSEITNTFNLHFRQFRTIMASNVSRDFGNLRKKNPPPVGVDANQNPQLWYLHDTGKILAQKLGKGSPKTE